MKHVLIGGNGFLGRQLTRDLRNRGADVVVADIAELGGSGAEVGAAFVRADITKPNDFDAVPLAADDVVHHLAAKLIVPNYPSTNRHAYFWTCIHDGTRNVLDWMRKRGCANLVYWSSDMVYGPALQTPRPEDHPRQPFGPYGQSKVASEDLCFAARKDGMKVTILRPRLIIGPGRLGIFSKLFSLIERNRPVPLIGDGSNHFQFVSVADCAAASILVVEAGLPQGEYNLGSAEPPTVRQLLSDFIQRVGSRSRLIATPAGLVKATLSVLNRFGVAPMDPEQYMIADQDVVLSIARAERDLGWRPTLSDTDMLVRAYETYRRPGADTAEALPA